MACNSSKDLGMGTASILASAGGRGRLPSSPGDGGVNFRERHLWLFLAIESEHDFRGAARGVIEQAFVDVADLFDIEGAEAEAALLASAARRLHFQELEGAEKVKYGAVVDGAWPGGRAAPIGARRAAFQERETFGVKGRRRRPGARRDRARCRRGQRGSRPAGGGNPDI